MTICLQDNLVNDIKADWNFWVFLIFNLEELFKLSQGH